MSADSMREKPRGYILTCRRRTGQINGGMVRHHRGRGVADKYQGKDIEGGGHVSLDDCKEGHQNSPYWDHVDWVADSEYNGGPYHNGNVESATSTRFYRMRTDKLNWTIHNKM